MVYNRRRGTAIVEFPEGILVVSENGKSKDSGFARSTVIIHLERLGSEELILKEKKPSRGRGRPEFLYRSAETSQPKATSQPNIIVMEFSKLKKACRYEKGGYCKLARDKCATQNCRLIMKPNKIY